MQTLASVDASAEMRQLDSEAKLQELIPIAMVIVGGCEPCAEKLVTRAFERDPLQ